MKGRIVVLGVGNELLKDEGVGIHIVRALEAMTLPDGVEVIDGGTSPDALHLVQGADKLVIVDAVKGGGDPATVYRFTPKDVALDHKEPLSLHEMGLLENLSLLAQLGDAPKDIVIIGVEPKDMDLGLELSPEVRGIVPKTIKAILQEVVGTTSAEPTSSSVGEEKC